jgi:L-ribulose-5-phosphate 4-epimerase
MADLGLVGAKEGNLSVRIDSATVLITPTGSRKRELREPDFVRVNLDTGGVLRGKTPPPSSELPLHLAIYRTMPHAVAVAHAHPLYVLALDRARIPIEIVSPEADLPQGAVVPTVPPLQSGSEALAVAAVRVLETSGLPVAVLSGHGAVVWGNDPKDAVDRLELLERSAQVLLLSRLAHRSP